MRLRGETHQHKHEAQRAFLLVFPMLKEGSIYHMPLDPQVQVVLEAMAASGAQPFYTQPVAYAREAVLALPTMGGEPEPVASAEDLTIPGPQGAIPVRIYTPEGTGPFPVEDRCMNSTVLPNVSRLSA